MRITTLLAAAALAAGFASSQAQNVYSENVVGYVNVSLPAGFAIVANQLDLDGTGTNNTVSTVFGTNLPNNSTVYSFNAGAYDSATYTTKGGWGGSVSQVNASLNGGNGVFVKVPSATTLTLIGNVRQGTLTKNYGTGFNLLGSQVPQAGLVQTDLGFVPANNDIVYRFLPGQTYQSATYTTKGGWGTQPTIGVAEGFWLNTQTANTWTRNFTVAP
jgi:hypothetical protein